MTQSEQRGRDDRDRRCIGVVTTRTPVERNMTSPAVAKRLGMAGCDVNLSSIYIIEPGKQTLSILRFNPILLHRADGRLHRPSPYFILSYHVRSQTQAPSRKMTFVGEGPTPGGRS